MALGLLGARGERHVHRRRSACDRLHSCGVWRGPRQGGGGDRVWAEEMVVRSALAARRGRDDCLKALPLPHSPQQNSCGGGGAPERTLLSGCASHWWRRRFDAFLSAFLLAKYAYVRWQFPPVSQLGGPECHWYG